MTHMALPTSAEINGNLIALNAFAGIPLASIIGFRAPYLNYSVDVLNSIKQAGFLYDSSATSTIPVTDTGTDAYWYASLFLFPLPPFPYTNNVANMKPHRPYTLDYGLANNCQTFDGICSGKPALPGLWEIPMYAIFDEKGAVGAHLMDPWLCVFFVFFYPLFCLLRRWLKQLFCRDGRPADVLDWMKSTFTAHCMISSLLRVLLH
jgi:hypothetical protein